MQHSSEPRHWNLGHYPILHLVYMDSSMLALSSFSLSPEGLVLPSFCVTRPVQAGTLGVRGKGGNRHPAWSFDRSGWQKNTLGSWDGLTPNGEDSSRFLSSRLPPCRANPSCGGGEFRKTDLAMSTPFNGVCLHGVALLWIVVGSRGC